MKRQDARTPGVLPEPDEELDGYATDVINAAIEVVGESCLDLLVADRLVVELNAIEVLAPIHWIQVRSYLRATGCILGLLINFNVPVLLRGVRRVILRE